MLVVTANLMSARLVASYVLGGETAETRLDEYKRRA